ncbi:MAG: 2'-5' RNA ligase family protein [Pseudomonadota bacterium]
MAETRARLFLALWPGAAVRAQLGERRDDWRWPRAASPVADGRLHLTLHFLGEVERARVAPLA